MKRISDQIFIAFVLLFIINTLGMAHEVSIQDILMKAEEIDSIIYSVSMSTTDKIYNLNSTKIGRAHV